jgi:hypothetical protein
MKLIMRFRTHFVFLLILVVLAGASIAQESVKPSTAPVLKTEKLTFAGNVKPLLEEYCYDCHGGGAKKGGFALDIYPDEAALVKDRKTWDHVLNNVRNRVMPPEKKPQPTDAQRDLIAAWIESEVFKIDCNHPDPGRVTIRRLNRAEYNNTIRDLVGVNFQAAADLPADDSGYGFDNIGDVLSLPPVLLEKYLAAAEKILNAAIVSNDSAGSQAGKSVPTLQKPAGEGEPKAEMKSPANADPSALPESHKRIFVRQPTPETKKEVAREIIANFGKRAYRRPVTTGELERLVKLFEMGDRDGENFEKSVKLALEAVLVSPHFLFRGELQPDPDNSQSVHPISEFSLASRLSYFLWSSMPDDELLAQAERETLRKNLEAQVRRMLKDPKARALVDNFAGQWLQIRDLQLVRPDWEEFPEFDKPLRVAMQKETELFFEHILREDRSVLDFLDGDYTFVNERLARHYGFPNVKGDEFQRVSLKGTPRGGVFTQASILTITSNPTRTSPVKRGKWVLENLLGTPPPPPPPEVPELSEKKDAVLSGSLRQRMEQHREKPMCASCHARMDPIGFGLENFNAIGEWRGQDGKFPIDPSGQLVSGESFKGPAELRSVLLAKKKEEFVRCLAEKVLTYALGRGLEYYDKCAVNSIAKGLAENHYTFSALVLEVVKSVPFQMRRGEEGQLASAAR